MSNKNLMRGIYKKFYLFYKLTSIFFYWGFLQFILYKSQERHGMEQRHPYVKTMALKYVLFW